MITSIKNCQLDMLIFVQVCRTIYKKFSVSLKHKVLEEQMRAMETTRRKLEAYEEKRF